MSGEPRDGLDQQALQQVKDAMRRGDPWVILRLTKSGYYQVARLGPAGAGAPAARPDDDPPQLSGP